MYIHKFHIQISNAYDMIHNPYTNTYKGILSILLHVCIYTNSYIHILKIIDRHWDEIFEYMPNQLATKKNEFYLVKTRLER